VAATDCRVAILLASYNGAAFIEQQLESIQKQSCESWHLFIRDDGSDDNTLAIIEQYAHSDDRISIISDEQGNLGAAKNFSCLLDDVVQRGYEYVFLSDQDDVWETDKMCLQLLRMQQVEHDAHAGSPVLVYSDLALVDSKLERLHPSSFMTYQGMNNQRDDPLSVLLVQNYITGCTVLINRQLLELALPVPYECVMHDWWLALCAASCGKISYVDTPLVKYRQHGGNEVGAVSIQKCLNPWKVNWWRFWVRGRNHLQRSMEQAAMLAERVESESGPVAGDKLETIVLYATLMSLPRLQRIKRLNMLNVRCQSRLRHILMLSRLLSLPVRS